MPTTTSETREAEHGERMIEVTIRLWTDAIAEVEGQIVPKHAWSYGVARVSPNRSHGIVGRRPTPFNTLDEIPTKIRELLVEQGIKLHLGPAERRLFDVER